MLWRALEWRAHLCQRDKPPMNICDQANTVDVCRGSMRLCTVWVQCGLRRTLSPSVLQNIVCAVAFSRAACSSCTRPGAAKALAVTQWCGSAMYVHVVYELRRMLCP
jgi:hypothetical protein